MRRATLRAFFHVEQYKQSIPLTPQPQVLHIFRSLTNCPGFCCFWSKLDASVADPGPPPEHLILHQLLHLERFITDIISSALRAFPPLLHFAPSRSASHDLSSPSQVADMSFSSLVSDIANRNPTRPELRSAASEAGRSYASTAATSVSISGDIKSQLHGGYSHPLARAWQAERQLTKVCSRRVGVRHTRADIM